MRTTSLLIACVFAHLLAVDACAVELTLGNNAILTFGDSTTAPRIVDGQPLTVYSDILRAELPTYGITGAVNNQGVGGNTTNDAMARFYSDVIAQNPDLVIMQFGINDMAVDVWKDPPATESRVSLAQFTSNMTFMTQQLKSAGSEVILMTPNPLRWTTAMLEAYGAPPYDPNDPMGFNVILVDYAQAVRNIAESEQVDLLDVYNMYVDYGNQPGQEIDDLLLDGVHPNAAGHRLIGDALIANISSVIMPPQTIKSSAEFQYKYEANSDLPSVEDSGPGKTNWEFFDHPNCDANFQVSDGTLSYSTTASTTGGEWFYSDANVADSAWAANVSETTSYTMEFSARVTGGTGNVPGMHTVIKNGAETTWLNVAPDHVAISNGEVETSLLLGAVDNATDFHQYRIAFNATAQTYHVWRDGMLIGKDISASGTSSDRSLAFGDTTSDGFGDAEIDYVRWDATNAYTPVAPAPEPQTEKDSGDFRYKYEANNLPTIEDTGIGKTNWAIFDHPECDAEFQASGGVLSYSTTDDGTGGEWFYSDKSVSESAWASDIGMGNSFTVEFSARVTDGAGDLPGLHAIFDNGLERAWLTIGTDHVNIGDGDAIRQILADEIDNATEFHTYRIAFDATNRKLQVWRDSVHIGVDLFAPLTSYQRGIFFGDMTSSGFGTGKIDFIRWDPTGAYAPVSAFLQPGDANGDGAVDVSDLGILATHYGSSGKTWEQGDFTGDGAVDVSDLGILATYYGTDNTAVAIPEPGIVPLLLIGAVSLLFWREKRPCALA